MGKPPPAPTIERFPIVRGRMKRGQRVGLYGEGGIGKSTLASLAPTALFLECEAGTANLDVARIIVDDFKTLLDVINDPGTVNQFDTLIIDTMTAVEGMATTHALRSNPMKDGVPRSLEAYGFGKGFRFLFETMDSLFQQLDPLAERGKDIICVAHVAVERVPNPEGEDFLQWQPKLTESGKTGQVRSRFRDWLDHLFFINWDRHAKDGKASGSGTRTLYTQPEATFWAKSRSLHDEFPIQQGDAAIWTALKESTQ